MNEECTTCKLEKCPEECFNKHEGSVIALQKLTRSMGINATIITDDGVIIDEM